MAFIKTQRVESVKVASDHEHGQIKQVLASTGKDSVAKLTDAERSQLPKS